MQRGHPEVAKEFALHFDDRKTNVEDLEFEVTEALSQLQQRSPLQVKSGSRPWF
jgi:hypothetical protein